MPTIRRSSRFQCVNQAPGYGLRQPATAYILWTMKNSLVKHLIVLWLIPGIFLFMGLSCEALSAEACPPVLAGFMPKNAVKVTGQYTPAGMISMGGASADLPFTNPCSNQTTKYPGRITFDVQHYTGDGVTMLKMQVDAVEQQALSSKKAEFDKRVPKPGSNPKLLSVSPVKTEKVSGGTIIYYEYVTDCSEEVKRSKPTAQLFGVAHTDSTRITLNVEGFISAEAAKAAAIEVLNNFAKAKFN